MKTERAWGLRNIRNVVLVAYSSLCIYNLYIYIDIWVLRNAVDDDDIITGTNLYIVGILGDDDGVVMMKLASM